MNQQSYPSYLLENAVNRFSELPGVGRKTALRYVLHLLKREEKEVEDFVQSILLLKSEVKYCKICRNISDTDICRICSDKKRDTSLICVVETIKDVMAIENTGQYKGLYHVLGGVISPMEGIRPDDLEITTLLERAQESTTSEVILALSTTMEGDTTNYYIARKLKEVSIQISTIARGVPIGDELQYADELTLGRSIHNRIPYDK